jgi:ribosome-associated protein
MDIRKLQRAIVDGLEDVKAQNVVVFNTEHLSAMFERVIIASGTSNRQTKALAASVRDAVRKRGMQVLRTEGEDNGEWIIVDCGAAVAHIMQPAIRDYYHLEEIWGGKSVRIKVAAADGRLVKASEPDDVDTKAAPARKPGRARVTEDTVPARPRSGAAPAAKKAPARKATGRAAPAKAAGKAPAAKAPARTAAKAPARTAAKTASKAAAKPATKAPAKTAAKRAPAKATRKA